MWVGVARDHQMGDPVYSLSQEIDAHSEDVRAITAMSNDVSGCPRFASASRDCTVKIWQSTNASGAFQCKATLAGHSHFVHAVIYDSVRDRLISASRDHSFIVWDPVSGANSVVAEAHDSDVVALAVTKEGDIATGSWDGMVRVWRQGKRLCELVGHEQAVLCCLALPNDTIVTGGADNVIKVWQNGMFLANIEGHTQPVRAMQPWKDIGFVSVGNDSW